jgi:hypothetical protein
MHCFIVCFVVCYYECNYNNNNVVFIIVFVVVLLCGARIKETFELNDRKDYNNNNSL